MRIVLLSPIVAALLIATTAAPQPRPSPIFPQPMLGVSLFRAAWAYRHDRPWLESQLEWLSAHRVDAIRALGVVGDPSAPDYWDGREIDWRWPDYDEVIAGVTDLAFDKYGIRVQWTIFGGAQDNTPREADRAALVDRFLKMSRGRQRKILAFEIANEFWQNGFEGAEGIRQLRAYAAKLRQASSIPVAASSHRDELCPLYADGSVDFATIHFDRGKPEARWAPLTEPWSVARRTGRFASCAMPAEATNNEPIGPGSSSSQPMEPLQIVMSAVNTYLVDIPLYVFHSGPGVRDDPTDPKGMRPSRLDQLPEAAAIFDGLAVVKDYIPRDVLSWRSLAATDKDFPFAVHGTVPVALAAVSGANFIVAFSGLTGAVEVTARDSVDVKRLDPMTGATLATYNLKAGDPLRLDSSAVVLEGSRRKR